MINIPCFQSSILLGWAEQLLNPDAADWKDLATEVLRPVGGKAIFRSNVEPYQIKGLQYVKNSFWREVIVTWLTHNKHNYDDTSVIADSPIFNNKFIRFKKSHLYFKECLMNNIVFVKDVISNGHIIAFNDFKNLISSPNSIIIYNCIFNALRPFFQSFREESFINTPFSLQFCDIEVGQIGRKGFYNIIRPLDDPLVENYWSRKLTSSFPKGYWMTAIKASKECRLRVLQWKIIMKLYPTSIMLEKMKIRNSSLCQTCKVNDTLEHFFYECLSVTKVWNLVNTMIHFLIGHKCNVNWESALFGFDYIKEVNKATINKINLIVLLAKHSISKYKYGCKRDPVIIFEHELNIRNIRLF